MREKDGSRNPFPGNGARYLTVRKVGMKRNSRPIMHNSRILKCNSKDTLQHNNKVGQHESRQHKSRRQENDNTGVDKAKSKERVENRKNISMEYLVQVKADGNL
ncbi:hypothetical protein K469DRAFT_690649 [Zopfia rhizophila CBS 207.26]|uniref:Uncharacterized protein n=1 Tax=Zopfia rhizophila CBS 207.26 TaxID=1314779 RepID=A0A6A6DWA5_9PEZI|nr:hypothetical protein K469DRAFT_690649 [Zopfia rhizophila CBS 207.26]